LALDGDNLWFFVGEPPERPTQSAWAANGLGVIDSANGEGKLNQFAGRHAHLLKFQKGAEDPRQIPLWFDLNKGILSGEWLQSFRHYNPTEPMELGLTIFQPTPEYFVMACANLRGFWLIPRSELEGPPRSLDLNAQLVAAAEAGNVPGAKDILARGAAVDARNYGGLTPLMIAAYAGNLDLVKLLIEKGADVRATATAGSGATVLCYASEGNNLNVVKELLKHGAAVNAPGNNGITPFYIAVGNNLREMAELLIASGADVSAFGTANEIGLKHTPLMLAALKGFPDMVGLLLANGAKIEQVNSIGDTALMSLAKTENPGMVKLLLAKGANVNATGPKGRTALFYAAYNGCVENIKLLLAAGADPNAVAPDMDDFGAPAYDPATVAERHHKPLAQALIVNAQAKAAASKK